jgi:hypothetical protein
MTLNRALWASPLAVAVAVLAHVVVFGAGHAPGAEHASGLLGFLAAALGLALGATFLAGALGVANPIATGRRFGYSAPLALTGLSAVTFGLIELSEGHPAAATWLAAILVMLPIALAVTWLAERTTRAVYGAGIAFASFALAPRRRGPATSLLLRAYVPVRAVSIARGARRGRAPPFPL